ncbi:chorismate mutase [Alkalicoccus luteus]|uniref:chorismate mutase n=1 Tax=Alkalicoccus luteus TaxID=1237094 RepID=A0A969PZ30_9BACI|nr:chorismate mutase [Alkalicoccus luteus]NJP38192.1 chorismate mutase [Alkalicoccus luteus]
MIRGIRGAATVNENTESEILVHTERLMKEIELRNELDPEQIAHVIVTVTEDIDATFPARALRDIAGYQFVPVMCSREIPVPGSMPLCIRLMVTVETDLKQKDIQHVYLGKAASLRPDLSLTNNEG